jgi:hypothetical protein
MYNLELVRLRNIQGGGGLPSPIWVSSAKVGQARAHFKHVRSTKMHRKGSKVLLIH